MGRRALGRSGLTLVELLVALTVTTIAGAALIKVMLAQNRASGTNEAWRVARAVSRGSLNRLLADLSIAEAEGALDGLTVDGRDITLRVPYAIGVACNTTLPLAATMLPVDDAQWSAARFAGFAWRDNSTSAYRYRTGFVQRGDDLQPGHRFGVQRGRHCHPAGLGWFRHARSRGQPECRHDRRRHAVDRHERLRLPAGALPLRALGGAAGAASRCGARC